MRQIIALLLIRDFLANTNTIMLPQPPYSPDLAPGNFSFFPKLKSTLKGRRFQTIQEITENTRDPEKRVPGLFPEVASMQEGSSLKAMGFTQLQACPKKLYKKTAPKLFEQTTYV
jgi:hypothetical protein